MPTNKNTTDCAETQQKEIKIAKKNPKLCTPSRQFQCQVVESWNPFAKEVTKVFLLPASKHKESSAAGNGNVFGECTGMVGLTKEVHNENEKFSHCELDNGLED